MIQYQYHFAAALIGCGLDALIGDPHGLPHPVCAIGWLIGKLERLLRRIFGAGEKAERRAGTCMVILVLLVTGAAVTAVLYVAYAFSPFLGIAVEGIMCGQMMAWRSLRTESMKVYRALAAGDGEGAKRAVSMIVGRDTEALTDVGVAKAAVETVAENASDGVIAPLLYMAAAGGLGIWLYKAVNTMDSMVGYKNERYLWFGRTAAKLDDICNYIPARVSSIFMICAGYVCQWLEPSAEKEKHHYCGKNGTRIFLRDRYNHKSPNSAQTESVCAGVLGIELAGNAYYFGKLYEKPTIGDAIRPAEYEDIRRANRLMTGTYFLTLTALALVCMAAILII